MRVKDELLWLEQVKELSGDEASVRFRDFLVFWMDTADVIGDEAAQQTPRDSLLQAFEVAEQTLGYLSMEWLGQMLLVIVQHWFDGDSLWESLSVWERRLIEQALAMKLVDLQESAKVHVDGENPQAPPTS